MKKVLAEAARIIISIMVVLIMTTNTATAYSISNQVANDSTFQMDVKDFTVQNAGNQLSIKNYETNDVSSQERLLVSKKTNDWQITIDYTDTTNGYIMILCTTNSEKSLKVSIEGTNELIYMYNLNPNQWTTLSFSEGNGSYTVTIYQNIEENKYKRLLEQEIDVELSNDLPPFLSANQYVNFTNALTVIQKAKELTQDCQTDIEKISAISNYVVSTMTYDYEKAENVSSKYLPSLEEILKSKTGICLDYAALIVGMLRSQNIPAKMVFGYSGEEYHAWISVYIEEQVSSLCGMTYYDEEHWLHMDPTFASGQNNSRAVLRYINNSDNYSVKYCY